MPNKARALATSVAALTVLTLAACSTTNGQPGAAVEPQLGPGAQTVAPAPQPDPGAEPVHITYLHRLPNGEGMVQVEDIVARWNAANPNIQVTSEQFSGASADMTLRLETDIQAGVGPCLAQIGYGEVPDVFVRGMLMDVTPYAEQFRNNFSPGAWAMMNVGGQQIGIPQDVGPLIYMYNATAFEELGLEVPTNMEEFIAASRIAREHGRYLSFWGVGQQHALSAQAAAAGDVWFSAVDDQWHVDTFGPGTQRVAEFWQTLIDEDLTLDGSAGGDTVTVAMANGTLIGRIAAGWEVGFSLNAVDGTPYEGQWRVALLPDFGAGRMTGPNGGSGVAVMAGCDHPAEAMAFNNWFNTQIDDLATQGLIVAANGEVETPANIARQFGGQDVMAVLAEATQDLNPNFVYAPGFATLVIMNQVGAAARAGEVPVSEIFLTAQTTAVDALRDLGLPVAD